MKKVICILLLVLSMGAMYYFSSQDGRKSSEQSNKVVKAIDEVRNEVTLKDPKLISIKDKIFNKLRGYGKSFVVRKAAHFSIYACIGVSILLVIYIFLKKVTLSAIIAFVLAVMYAVFDERRQLAIDGRAGSIKDVFIDSAGAFTGIFIVAIILLMGKGIWTMFSKKSEDRAS